MDTVFFPPEWHEQSAIQLTWPHASSDWDYMLQEVTACFVTLAREILERQHLIVVCQNLETVRMSLKDTNIDNLTLIELESNDTWARDHSPLSVFIDGKPTIYDFTFNGWGLKFPSNFDNQIGKNLFSRGVFSSNVAYRNKKDFVLEGGAIESDGKGTLLTTGECLLSPNRNSYFTKEQIEDYLKNNFGLERVLWLDYGYLSGDDTDSHIDTLARFCDERTIAYVKCYDSKDEHYESLHKMEEQLKSFTDYEGNPYKLVPLPLPNAIYDNEGQRLPATYANFLIMNKAILLPVYDNNEEKNKIAIEALGNIFPSREIIPVNCTPLIQQHGSLHCVTMQYPAGFIQTI